MNIVFVNVDTQKDFISKKGSLYVQDSEIILPNLAKLTKLAKDFKIRVVNTMDYHTSESKELSNEPDFVNTFPNHCMAGTEGSEFVDETNPHQFGRENYYIVNYNDENINETNFQKARNIIIYKDKFDVFEGNPHSDKILKLLDPDLVIVYGVTTPICVNYAVLGITQRGYLVTVVSDAIKELPNIPLESIFSKWYEAGVIMETTKNIVKNVPKLL